MIPFHRYLSEIIHQLGVLTNRNSPIFWVMTTKRTNVKISPQVYVGRMCFGLPAIMDNANLQMMHVLYFRTALSRGGIIIANWIIDKIEKSARHPQLIIESIPQTYTPPVSTPNIQNIYFNCKAVHSFHRIFKQTNLKLESENDLHKFHGHNLIFCTPSTAQNCHFPFDNHRADLRNFPNSVKIVQCNPEPNKNIQIQTHTSRILVLVEPLSLWYQFS